MTSYDPTLMQRRAAYYLRLGMALTPVKWASKQPAYGKGWNHRENLLTTREQAAQWFARPYNIGVHLGASGLVSVDVDDLNLSRTDFAARGLDVDQLIADHPHPIKGNGIRLWYRARENDPIQSRRFHAVGNETAYEIRGGDGFQDVAPGSLHPNGFEYQWLTEAPRQRGDLPELPEFLYALYDALGEKEEKREGRPAAHPSSRPYQGESVIDAFNARYSIHEVLERNGYKRRGGRYLSPHSKSKDAGVDVYVDGDKCRAVSYHTSDFWSDKHGHDAFDLFTLLEHDGTLSTALDTARRLLGMERPAPAAQTPVTRPAAELWNEYAGEVCDTLMDRLASARGHQRSRQTYMDLIAALCDSATSGDLKVRDGKALIEFGGLARLAERMLYRGRLHDLRAALDYLTTLGMVGRVVSTNPEDRYAPLAVEVTADPRHLPALTFQGALTLKSTSYTTTRRKATGTTSNTLDTTKRKPGYAVVSKCETPLHDARFVLYWIRRGACSVEQVARMGRMRTATVRRHLAALEMAGMVVDFQPQVTPEEGTALIRREVESDPAYRAARMRYLESALSFGARGCGIAARVGAERMKARRLATHHRAHDRLTRLQDGETCGAVFGVVA